ncbi:MAG: type II toxin-antitoxin system VapC family toxin [Acidimicrobiales bacterium]
MIVVDTTVLVYAVGADHPLRAPCRALVEAVEAGAVRATTTVEVVQEFAHVRARRRPRRDAATLARSYTDLFAPLLPVEADDLRAGLKLFERTESLGPFDAVLAATALRRGANGLASADAGFGDVRGLRHLDPADPGFAAQLGADR